MDSKSFTPQESLDLISKVISDARQNFKDDGIIYIMWGILTTLAGAGQFVLLQLEYYSINYFPYFIMPIGGIISCIYYMKKEKRTSNTISKLVGTIWFAVMTNNLILGFVFSTQLQDTLSAIILIFIGVGTLASGTALKEKVLLISGISINLLGLSCFFIDWEYHPLIIALTGFFFTLIPGIILNKKK